MAELFGFSFKKKDVKSRAPSPIAPSSDDGATSYIAGGYYGQYLDLDGNFKTEYDMVKKYREMAMHPEVDEAIEDIIHEAIVADPVSYTHLRAHETGAYLVCRLLLEKK